MLVGTADPAALARGAPQMPSLDTPGLVLEGVQTLQGIFEIASGDMLALFPPGLHPTLPPLVRFVVTRVSGGELGAFSMAELRVECRSGLRPRGFTLAGFVDQAEVGRALVDRFGFPLRDAEVELLGGYHEIRAGVSVDGEAVLALALVDPVPLQPADVQFVSSVHLAHTPRGLRLVQVDFDHDARQAQRGTVELGAYVADAFGTSGVVPVYPVAAAWVESDLTLPALRYLCAPEALAFTGTEVLPASAS